MASDKSVATRARTAEVDSVQHHCACQQCQMLLGFSLDFDATCHACCSIELRLWIENRSTYVPDG